MKTHLSTKKLPKNDREQAVLFGLVDLYLKTGKPIGSQTLQENGFESLSSATIRNYFAKLEEGSLLKQPHTSGGRIPTTKALRLYADLFRDQGILEEAQSKVLEEAFLQEGREISALIHQGAETLSRLSKCAVFATMPRFDQDFIQDVRLLLLDKERLLAVVITDFGQIRTETIYLEQEVDEAFARLCERYFLWRLNKGEKITFESLTASKLAARIYNEIMVRHVVGYLNFPTEDLLRCGISRLLAYPEFNEASAVVSSLSLLEDEEQMRSLLRHCSKEQTLTYWIGDELCPHVPPGIDNAVIAIPYRINQAVAGSIALLGPVRLPYRELFGLIRQYSELLSNALTDAVYKFKITFRQPTGSGAERLSCNSEFVKESSNLLEDQREKEHE